MSHVLVWLFQAYLGASHWQDEFATHAKFGVVKQSLLVEHAAETRPAHNVDSASQMLFSEQLHFLLVHVNLAHARHSLEFEQDSPSCKLLTFVAK